MLGILPLTKFRVSSSSDGLSKQQLARGDPCLALANLESGDVGCGGLQPDPSTRTPDGIGATINGLGELAFFRIIFQIKLLQHTPRFKSSYEQAQRSCNEVNEVTKWLRSLSSR
jgi:hypothetical protein